MRNQWIPFLRREPIDLTTKNGRDIDDDGEFLAILNATYRIDEACFGSLPEYAHAAIPRGLSTTWIGINPDIYTFLIDRASGSVKGYINAMPVSDAALAKLKRGELRDKDITADDIQAMGPNATLNIYLMSVAISPGVRRAGDDFFSAPFEKLLYAFVRKLENAITQRNVRIREIVAVAWTPEGRRLCEMLGLEKIGVDPDNHPIFRIDLGTSRTIRATNGYRILRPLIEAQERMAAS